MGSNWSKTALGDIMSFTNGKLSPPRHNGLPYPVYGANGIIGFSDKENANEGTIVIGRVGSYCGSIYYSKQKCWVTDNAIRANAQRYNDPQFLFYLLGTLNLNNMRGGSGQPLLNQTILSSIFVSVPPYNEQRAIASVLGTLDDKIELNRRMNETLEAMARAIFKSWFVDFDPIPGFGPYKEWQDTPLGRIPKGWRVDNIGDIAENIRQGVRPEEITPATPYIGLEHMPRKCIALSDWGHVEDVISNKFQFQQGDILFGKLRPYFHKVGVAPINGICSTDILVIVPKQQIWYGFLLSHISSDEFVSHTDATSTGTKMPRTNWASMARYQIAIPPDDIGKSFTEKIEPMSKSIHSNIHQSRTLAAIRDAFLPKLLSGEIRVKDAEKFLEASA